MFGGLVGRVRRVFLRLLRPRFLFLGRRHLDLITLGSPHGAKVLALLPGVHDTVLISGGVGEDISFDLEFLRTFGGQIALVDPTDRAESHFKSSVKRAGEPARTEFSSTGSQPVESYSLVDIKVEHLHFYKRALWSSDDEDITLYPPPNPEHVSFSATGIQGKQGFHSEPLISQTITVERLLNEFGMSGGNYILKLDIEGAAREVLRHVISSDQLPSQIILEFDEMFFPSFRNYLVVSLTRMMLWRAGYRMVSVRGFDVTYVRRSFLH